MRHPMDIETAESIIKNDEVPIARRMRSLFYLRNILLPKSVNAIAGAFASKSILLKHEAAYVLGQMCMEESVPVLLNILSDENENEIVRHEAGEALGNFKPTKEIVEGLEKYVNHPLKPISETCYLALMKLKNGVNMVSKFGSRDPASPMEGSFEEAREILLNKNECLYRRYQAMFYLRDLGTSEAIHALGKAMEDESSLFKHEISFVFGQMRSTESIPYLIKGMEDVREHGMVRHECAEALGAIGNDKSLEALVKYLYDPCDILRESVEVAVDIHNYMNSCEIEYCTVQ
ncbi:deoxyhypusine hydroxylase [Encephalitozoon hellem]|uniref:Deoxyhypusine hydroxylase n=2 Tax=Encephalitozoon hellem TaxID=27973 RepID=A0A9Q9CCK2_ENCHE|nr:deoxyhypusine hydroxylase [Encephalitozoon hellem]WEL38909.1 deoxyhypusine hydroxylase [Encephalitozoon hellem]